MVIVYIQQSLTTYRQALLLKNKLTKFTASRPPFVLSETI